MESTNFLTADSGNYYTALSSQPPYFSMQVKTALQMPEELNIMWLDMHYYTVTSQKSLTTYLLHDGGKGPVPPLATVTLGDHSQQVTHAVHSLWQHVQQVQTAWEHSASQWKVVSSTSILFLALHGLKWEWGSSWLPHHCFCYHIIQP